MNTGHFFPAKTTRKLKVLLVILLVFCGIAASAANGPVRNDSITRTLKWKYGGYAFTTDLKFSHSDYNYYHGLSKTMAYSNYAAENKSHAYLLSLAAQLDADAKTLGYKNSDMVEYLTSFVQQAIPYKKDPANLGHDYPKFPIETIVDKGGDCEDKSALLAALLNTFGFDAVLVALPKHMAVALWSDRKGTYYTHHNKRYVYIETTATWKIGSMPAKYKKEGAKILDVARPLQFKRDPSTALTEAGKLVPEIGEVNEPGFAFSAMIIPGTIAVPEMRKALAGIC